MFKYVFTSMACALSLALFAATAAAVVKPVHGVAMYGDLKYPADFKHLDYVNPDAPKGGEMRLAAQGTFDSLNPFSLKGIAAPGLGGLVYETLTTGTGDEPFSEYGLIAETIEIPADRSYVVFNLRKQARFHDGKPVTAADVVFSFETLIKHGHPFYRAYYSHVTAATAENPHRVRFVFDQKNNRELPLIMGQMPVLPKHIWSGRDFDGASRDMPVGSGPYRVHSTDDGRRIVYERVKDWWGADLPVNRGRHNFDTIVYDLFRDETVLLQALFAGAYDFRAENIAKAWATEYNRQAVRDGLIRKEQIAHERPVGMQGFVFNIRRDVFADPKVRKALNHAFDFEWSNRQFAYDAYERTKSYFENSELASSGVPEGRELEILEQFRDKLPPELFTEAFTLPRTNGSGRDMRPHLSRARALLQEAGWTAGKNGALQKDGREFTFEILLHSAAFERWFAPFIGNLKRLGITATMRTVDAAQYQARIDSFDFDMTVNTFPQSLSPGNEQYDFWGSAKADVPGSRNVIGIKNPVVDALVREVVFAPDREELIHRTRALDRVLLWHYYLIPNWYIGSHRIAYWDKFGKPAVSPKYELGVPDTWWYDQAKAANVAAKARPEKLDNP